MPNLSLMTFASGARQLVVQDAFEIYNARWNVALKKRWMCAYDGVLGLVRLQVDTTHEHGRIGRGSRDDDLLRATLQVLRGPRKEKKSAYMSPR